MIRSDKFSDFFSSILCKVALSTAEKKGKRNWEAENKSVKNGTEMYI